MYCKNCGRKLEQDSIFCAGCGTKVEINNEEVAVTQTSNDNVPVQPKKKKKKRKFLIIILIIFILIFLGKIILKRIPKYFYGDDYMIEYSGDWSSMNTTFGYEMLQNDKYDLYFMPAGNLSLTEVTNSLSCNFGTLDCQKKIYDRFYYDFDDSLVSRDMNVFSGSNKFEILKDNIYYAYFDYGKSSTDRDGRFFLLVSPENSLLLSFTFEFMSGEDIEGNNEAMFELFNLITIDEKYE